MRIENDVMSLSRDGGKTHSIGPYGTEYRCNDLGQRISFHEDTEPDGVADGSDPTYQLIYDERWRLIAVYRDDDDNPKELFAYHQAGLDGAGGSSYIDSVILRQRDDNSGWTSAADGTLEQRRYYCQNWRADVSAVVTSGGVMVEWAKFTAYGIPIGLPAGDTDSDGDCDSSDENAIHVWAVGYDVRYDYDLDGDIDGDDETLANANNASTGWNVLSSAAVASRVGYAGYQKDSHLDLNHVRNRVYSAELGRWTRRDPLGYVDGMSVYAYAASIPATLLDPFGAEVWPHNQFNAFIGRTHANLAGGWMGYFHIPVGRLVWVGKYKTDNRRPFERGTSRIHTSFSVQTDWIGSTAAFFNEIANSNATQVIVWPEVSPGSQFARSKTSAPSVVWSPSAQPCTSYLRVQAHGKNPFIPWIPAIDFTADWSFTMYGDRDRNGRCSCVVRAQVVGVHDLYPDYEGIVDNYNGKIYWYISPDLKPGIVNLSLQTGITSRTYDKWVNDPPAASVAFGCCVCPY